jgi:hypothetical protein
MAYTNFDVNEYVRGGGGLVPVLSEPFNIVLVMQYSRKKTLEGSEFVIS